MKIRDIFQEDIERTIEEVIKKELILAIPVGPPDTVKELGKEADRVICLSTPRLFWAVGAFYAVFDQTSDEEVKRLLGVRREGRAPLSAIRIAAIVKSW